MFNASRAWQWIDTNQICLFAIRFRYATHPHLIRRKHVCLNMKRAELSQCLLVTFLRQLLIQPEISCQLSGKLRIKQTISNIPHVVYRTFELESENHKNQHISAVSEDRIQSRIDNDDVTYNVPYIYIRPHIPRPNKQTTNK